MTAEAHRSIEGQYFDGLSSRPQPVRLHIEGRHLCISGSACQRSHAIASLRVSEPFATTPRRLDFADGSHCEITENAALHQWLQLLGYRPSLILRCQAHWRPALAALGALALVVWLTYGWGLPWAARMLVPHIPPSFTERLSQQALASLEQSMLHPSALPTERQADIAGRLKTLLGPDDPAHRLLFRRSAGQANAFALPDGTIVVLDGLVTLAGNDDEVVAVLAHELGHVARQHGLRQFIQASAVAVATGLYFGDVSSLVGGFAALAGSARYSREFEIEADRFAAQRLQRHGLSPKLLARILTKLDKQSGAGVMPQALATHPDSNERIALLRNYR